VSGIIEGNGGANVYLAAVHLDVLLLLHGHVVRNADLALVTFDGCDHGESDAGVSRGSLHKSTPGLDGTISLRIFHNPQRGSILHTPCGVQVLALRHDLATCQLGETLYLDQRCVPHALQNSFSTVC
jgi:hypothetical protein